jgi:hypothetical protein
MVSRFWFFKSFAKVLGSLFFSLSFIFIFMYLRRSLCFTIEKNSLMSLQTLKIKKILFQTLNLV